MVADASRAAPGGRDELLEQLVGRLLGADQLGAMTVVERALAAGWSADDIRFSLITPAMYEIGDRWEQGRIGVGDEHLATSVSEWLLVSLAGRAAREPTTGLRVVVGCSEGELHCLGARLVAHVLAERGWRVLYLGGATPAEAWEQVVRARRPDVAVVCTTTRRRLERVAAALEAIKAARPACRTVVGGQAYWELPDGGPAARADLVALEASALAQRL